MRANTKPYPYPNSEVIESAEDSPAQALCIKFGGTLPTLEDYERLIRDFEHIETEWGPQMTPVGTKKYLEIFGEGNDSRYHTKTMYKSPDFFYSYVFSVNYYGKGISDVGFVGRRGVSYGVQCVNQNLDK